MKKILISLLTISICAFANAQKLDRSIKPKPGPAPAIKIGTPQKFALKNGLKVFVVSDHKHPIVSYSLVLDVDPQMQGNQMGYIEAAGKLLRTGTDKMTKAQIDAAVDQIGADLTTSATSVYGKCLTSHQNELLEVMSDIIEHANFTQEQLDKIKKKMASSQLQEKDDPDNIISNVKGVVDYGKNHPYGQVQTEQSIKNITLEKCKEYYESHFKPNVAYLAIVGDISFKEAKEMVERYFGDWQQGKVPTFTYSKPQKPKNDQVVFVNKPGAVQSVINVTYPVYLKPGDKDEVPAQLASIVLGGGATSRLFQDLRETHAYTYGAYSRIKKDKLVGNFTAFAKVRNPVTDSSVTRILAEMKKMGTTTMKNDELDGFKSYLTGNFALALEDPHTIARFAINEAKYHLPDNYYANYLKSIAAITPEQIKAASQKYITPDKANIIVVGDKDEVMKTLTKFDSDGKITQLDYTGNPVKQPTQTIPKGLTAQKVIDNYIAAIGGKDKLDAMKSIEMQMSGNIQGKDILIKTYKVKKHNQFATIVTMNKMVIQKQVYDGHKGFQSGMQGSGAITGKALDALKKKAKFNSDMDYASEGYKLSLEGIEIVNGKDAYKVLVVSPDSSKTTEYFDTKTGLKLRTLTTRFIKQINKSMTYQVDYDNYKAVKGVKFPYTINQQVGPQTINMKVDDIKINEKIDKSVFKEQ